MTMYDQKFTWHDSPYSTMRTQQYTENGWAWSGCNLQWSEGNPHGSLVHLLSLISHDLPLESLDPRDLGLGVHLHGRHANFRYPIAFMISAKPCASAIRPC